MRQQLSKPQLTLQHSNTRPLLFHTVKAARASRVHICASFVSLQPQKLLRNVQRAADHVNPARILQQMILQQDASKTTSATAPAPAVLFAPEAAAAIDASLFKLKSASSDFQNLSFLKQLGTHVAHATSAAHWRTEEAPPAGMVTATTEGASVPGQRSTLNATAPAGNDTTCAGTSSSHVESGGGQFLVVMSQPAEVMSLSHWVYTPVANVPEQACTGSTVGSSRGLSRSSSNGSEKSGEITGRAPGVLASNTVQRHSSNAILAVQQLIATPRTSVATSASAAPSCQLRFAKHLAVVSNGCAPPSARFESLGWLLFESNRVQAALGLHAPVQPTPPETLARAWVSSSDARQLLEQIYHIGESLADLGTADGLQPLSCSNGSRAIVSMDYAKLLERYLQQHGHLLAPEVWAHLPSDRLQAKAIHVATCLETRCLVHSMLFEKLIERVGLEAASAGEWVTGSLAAGAAGAAAGGRGQYSSSTGPWATAITNTVINTPQFVNSPTSSQSVVAAPSAAATGNTSSVNTTNTNSSSAAAPAAQAGSLLSLGSFGVVLILVWHAAGKLLKVAVAAVIFVKDVAAQLMMLRAVTVAAKGLAASSPAPSRLAASSPATSRLAGAPQAAAAAGSTACWSALRGLMSGRTAPAPVAAEPLAAEMRQQSWHSAPVRAQPSAGGTAQQAAVVQQLQQASGSSKLTRAHMEMVPVGSLGLLSATPLLTKQAANCKQVEQQQQVQLHVQQRQQQVQSDAVRPRGKVHKSWVRRQQHKIGLQSNPQLLYQLWAPEAARCA